MEMAKSARAEWIRKDNNCADDVTVQLIHI